MIELVALMLLSQQPLEPVAKGWASYYTSESSGFATASGDLLDDGQYTCAMRRGKFGGYYMVVAENGNSVICRLNDRGPYKRGRVIDLTEAAMKRLHPNAGEVGKLRVKVYRIKLDGIKNLLGQT